MTREEVFQKLGPATNLPTLPAILTKLTEAVRNPNSSAVQIAAIIKDDPAMMARILKVVNSAVYALPQPVQSLQQALAIMGMKAIHNVALTTAVFTTYSGGGAAGFAPDAFWRHSINAGIVANVLYDRTKGALNVRLSKDALHLSGLLHDIGKILLAQLFPKEFAEALRQSRERAAPLWQAEQELLGTTHAEVGAWLGQRWNLSPEVIQVIRWHHEPESADPAHVAFVRLVHVANHICNLENLGDGGNAASSFVLGVWKRLGLGVKDIEQVVELANAEAKKSETLLALLGEKKQGGG